MINYYIVSFLQMLKEPKFVYTVDLDVKKILDLEPRTWDFISRLEPKSGLVEHMPHMKCSGDLISIIRNYTQSNQEPISRVNGKNLSASFSGNYNKSSVTKPKIAVVGSGPSGLFACLVLAELGADVTLIERGQAVEQRGRDIGALAVRRILKLESNFCFGEVNLNLTFCL